MRKIEINIPEIKQLDINGKLYTIQKADYDIWERAALMYEMYSGLNQKDVTDARILARSIKELSGFIDELLGEGATEGITDGRAVGTATLIHIFKTVCEAVIGEYSSDVLKDYE